MKDLIKIVNHEAWIEIGSGRAYLKWGHYPNVDGKLDPLSITRVFAVAGGITKPVVVGMDKDSSANGGLFLEFDEADALAVEYDKGIYTLTEDGKWIFGRGIPPKYAVKEVRHILGFAKVYLSDNIVPLGLELELMPDGTDDEISVQILFRGKPVAGKVKLRNSEGSFELEGDESGVKLKLAKGVNVLSARYVDELGSVKRSMVTTLTILR